MPTKGPGLDLLVKLNEEIWQCLRLLTNKAPIQASKQADNQMDGSFF